MRWILPRSPPSQQPLETGCLTSAGQRPAATDRLLQTNGLAEVRGVAAGDRDGLVAARVGDEQQRSLEALLHLAHAAEIDQETAVDAQESPVLELLFEAVEAAGGGQEPSLIAHQPDLVVVGLGEADLPGVEENPPIVAHGDDPARQLAGRDG